MLHIKPQGHWPFGSGEEDFWRVFTIYGRGGHLGHVTQTPWTNFRSPIPLRLHTKFGFDRQSGLEKNIFENGGRRTDDIPWLYYKLTKEPKGSDELNIRKYLNHEDCQNQSKCPYLLVHLDSANLKNIELGVTKLYFNPHLPSGLVHLDSKWAISWDYITFRPP